STTYGSISFFAFVRVRVLALGVGPAADVSFAAAPGRRRAVALLAAVGVLAFPAGDPLDERLAGAVARLGRPAADRLFGASTSLGLGAGLGSSFGRPCHGGISPMPSGAGFCAWCGCSGPSYTASFPNIWRPSRFFGSIPFTAFSTASVGRLASSWV